MKKFVHPFSAKITDDEVMANKVFPLVRELTHKYKLLVFSKREMIDPQYNEYHMAREDGIPVCQVYFSEDREAYTIRNCMNTKDRGRSHEDKLTYFGKKVSFLMKTIEKEGLIPPDTNEFIRSVFGYQIRNGIDNFSGAYGEIRKGGLLGGEIQHQLIEIALGNRHVSTLSAELMTKVQSALDKYREADKTRVERKRELSEVFSAPVWAIIYDKTKSFCVGKLNLMPQWSDENDTSTAHLTMEIAEPFRRVADITEIPELIPTLTMLKVTIQQSEYGNKTFVGESEFFPYEFERVVPELRVMGTRSGTRWDRTALLDPKLLLVAV